MRMIIFIALLSTSLTSCSKEQPSEIDKADIVKTIPQCITKVTAREDEEPDNLMDIMTSLSAAMAEMQSIKKNWELHTDGAVVLDLKTEETLYSCKYIKSGERKWMLNTVLRNGEKVFDFDLDKKIRDKIKLDKEKSEKKEHELFLSTWHEYGYSNVDYKRYEKNDVNAKEGWGSSDRPKVVLVCKPDEPYFKYESGSFSSYSKKVKVSFDEAPAVDILLTSSGTIGKKEKIGYSSDVYSNSDLDKEFRKKLITAKKVKIEEYTFTMDNILTVPCINKQ